MSQPVLVRWVLLSVITLVLTVQSAYADIYKWVDENGTTHYSDTSADSHKSKVEKLPDAPLANVMQSMDYDSTNALIKTLQHKPSQQKKERIVASTKAPTKNLSNYRCTLARNIVSGKVQLTNGLPTGAHEIKVAKRDIQKFCK